jgi:hypothetical protein
MKFNRTAVDPVMGGKNSLQIVLLTTMLLFGSVPATLGGSQLAQTEENMKAMGITVDSHEKNGITELTFNDEGDNTKTLAALMLLRQHDIVSRDVTETQTRRAPVFWASIVATVLTAGYIQAFYADSGKIDRVKAIFNLRAADDYGRVQNNRLFSFSFNRALYKEIAWDNFRWDKFPKVAPQFELSEWAQKQMSEEQAGDELKLPGSGD